MKNFVIIFIFLITSSCHQDIYSGLSYEAPGFKDSVSVKATILNDTLYTRGAWGIASYKDYIILNTIMDDHMFQLYDKKSGKWIKNFGELGRGPEQIFKVSEFSVKEDEGILTAFNQNTREIYIFYLDSVINNKKHFIDKISLKKYDKMTFHYAYKCNDGFLLYGAKCLVYPEGVRFCLFSDKGELTARYDQYPFNSHPMSDSINNSADWDRLLLKRTLSPDGSKFAETTEIGGILQIFNINNSIEVQTIRGFYKPHFLLKNNQRVNTPKTQFWSYYVNSSNHYIYVLAYTNPYNDKNLTSEIQVFDWQGNPVKKNLTDQKIVSVCADEKAGKLYALTRNSQQVQTLCSFNL